MDTEKRWYVFIANGRFCGRCLTTEEEIRATFRHFTIEGSAVYVLSPQLVK